MIFTPTPIPGAFLIVPQPVEDQRGFFARTWCHQEFAARGLHPHLSQCSISFNTRKGTLRGMHFQDHPYPETKLVRCTKGALYDVVLDLRPQSPRFRQWHAVELTEQNHRMLYIPEGCAHGFQTLHDNTEVSYQISECYHPELSRGVRWNDRAFQIDWPLPEPIMSSKDRCYPDWNQ